MTNLIAAYGRATDLSGSDVIIVANATMYFYEAGTTTPLTVYTDSGLGTPRGASVISDSEGIFPQCWTSETQVKIDVKDSGGTSLDGFPQDNFPTFPASGQQASGISFVAVTGNGGATVQAAIANDAARINTLVNGTNLTASTGSSGAFALVPAFAITAYAANQQFHFIANHDGVGSGSDTLNVSGQGAVVIKKYDSAATKTDLVAGDIAQGQTVSVTHDGTHFVMTRPGLADTSTPGLVEAATSAEMTAGTAGKYPAADVIKTYVDDTNAQPLTHVELSADDTEIGQTGLSGYTDIRGDFAINTTTGGENIILEARVSAGTWRTLITRSHSASANDVIMGTFRISNFNNANGSGFKFADLLSALDANALDRSDNIEEVSVSTRDVGYSTYDEVWDEVRIRTASGGFEGDTADSRSILRLLVV